VSHLLAHKQTRSTSIASVNNASDSRNIQLTLIEQPQLPHNLHQDQGAIQEQGSQPMEPVERPELDTTLQMDQAILHAVHSARENGTSVGWYSLSQQHGCSVEHLQSRYVYLQALLEGR